MNTTPTTQTNQQAWDTFHMADRAVGNARARLDYETRRATWARPGADQAETAAAAALEAAKNVRREARQKLRDLGEWA